MTRWITFWGRKRVCRKQGLSVVEEWVGAKRLSSIEGKLCVVRGNYGIPIFNGVELASTPIWH